MERTPTQLKLLLGAAVLLLFIEAMPVFLFPESNMLSLHLSGSNSQTAAPQSISRLHGQSSLGEDALMVANENGALRELPLCQSLPEKGFALLLLAYIMLMAFNLRESSRKQGYPGGIFEILLTLVFLAIWFAYDDCRASAWFPLVIVKVGLILYIFAALTALDEQEPDTLF